MLACIVCSKRLNDSLDEAEDERGSGTPRSPASKEAIRTITTQIKDVALKFSEAYRHCKPCTPSSLYREGQQRCVDPDAASEGGTPSAGSSSSTPAWNITSTSKGHVLGQRHKINSTKEGTVPKLDNTLTDPAQNGAGSISVEEESKEWIAQVEPGVLITLVSLKEGGNDLRRIRFSREIFNKWQAQRWWTENYDKVLELYNVRRLSKHESAALPTPPRSEDERDPKIESGGDSPATPPLHNMSLIPKGFGRPLEASRTSSSRDADRSDDLQSSENVSVSNASEHEQEQEQEKEVEWVEEDEAGVYITIRCLAGGSREVRRVRFSREKFSEMQARLWWEENRLRIHEQYINGRTM